MHAKKQTKPLFNRNFSKNLTHTHTDKREQDKERKSGEESERARAHNENVIENVLSILQNIYLRAIFTGNKRRSVCRMVCRVAVP